jgi:hypothetical protein
MAIINPMIIKTDILVLVRVLVPGQGIFNGAWSTPPTPFNKIFLCCIYLLVFKLDLYYMYLRQLFYNLKKHNNSQRIFLVDCSQVLIYYSLIHKMILPCFFWNQGRIPNFLLCIHSVQWKFFFQRPQY